MKTKTELQEELKKRHLIHFKASLFFRDSKYLNNPLSEKEKKVADKNRFIRKTRYSFWVLSIFELCKLFGTSNDHYSIHKLINKLLNNFSRSEWKDLIEKEEIVNMQKKLYQKEIQDIIKNIRGLRDEYYGHLDKSPQKSIDEYTPNYEEVEKLFDLHSEILTITYKKIFDFEFQFINPGSGNADNILKNLSQ